MKDRPNAAILRQLDKAGARNSIVYHALVKARCGELSWSDAMTWAVIQLEGSNHDREEGAIEGRSAKVPIARPVKKSRPEKVSIAKPVQSSSAKAPVAKPVRSKAKSLRSESVFESDIVPRVRLHDEPTTVNIRASVPSGVDQTPGGVKWDSD